ncbi:GLPGLI family protein [Elizabethkingia miricola]|uniref:GLPGLI family protein n=1 Tax=Elizabethkingia miricola TaxID=172045 RepID=UPI000B3592BA|nr:GLPGLI family protein [Elizabethkingia miricola]NHQ69484.1 GLPGLI family protein [Elizabethkingia miricola]NHQ78567.1 GLPGLI family protein [Elizabethkingia miricola]PSL88579.1 GLPGLI family protein [Elizabethkingia miricola]QHQ88083.1 GLPGLI family protein [Elizabethkingia miricola]UIO95614.1 GLPGLI family protein [Elizabethkingia miricola]
MLKVKTFILLLIISCSLFIKGQIKADIEVNYETKIQKDSLNTYSSDIFYYTLLTNKNSSYYFSREEKEYFDVLNGKSMLNPENSIKTSMGTFPKPSTSKGSVYYNGTTIFASIPLSRYYFVYPEPSIKWEILNETKKICDYSCKLAKAITENGNVFYAWFTDDIPVSDGPFRFKGLAGLILEVYNQGKTIHITMTSIKKSTEEISPIQYLRLVKVKDKNEFIKARNNYFEDPSIYNGNMKLLDSQGNDKTYTIKEKLKKINVFLD